MEFTVPQFIEREPKIFGPFTFKQFIYLCIVGGVLIFVYFLAPFPLFLLIAFISIGSALLLVFLKIEGTPLPTVMKNFFIFLINPKTYLWRKKISVPKIIKKKEEPKKEIKEESSLKITEKSHLRKLITFLETK